MKPSIMIFLLVSTHSFCQTIHGIEAGLDSVAIANHIKSKFITTMKFDSTGTDTIWTNKYDYLPNGYLVKFEEIDIKNYDDSSPWKLGYHLIEFEYNENGYLINKNVRWDGPINVPETPDSIQITTKKVFKGNTIEKEVVVHTTWYDKNESFTDTTITFYNVKGMISEVASPPYYREIYYYDVNDLLYRIDYINSLRTFKRKEIKYEYYD